MAKRDWIGEYHLHVEEYQSYKNQWVEKFVSLGKCLSLDEACEKAVITLMREFPDNKVREVYIVDGWGHIQYMQKGNYYDGL